MTIEVELRAKLAELKEEITMLREEIRALGRRVFPLDRLGPRPETQEEVNKRTERLVEAIKGQKVCEHYTPPSALGGACLACGASQPEHVAYLEKLLTRPIPVLRASFKDQDDPTLTPPKPPALCTTSGEPVDKVRAEQAAAATGQHKAYIVLCPDERAKGFVRPYRDQYKHVGPDICGLQVGTEGSRVCFMDPHHEGPCGTATGPRPQACHMTTAMGRDLSETYARDPKFYGATFCCGCDRHLPVGEFVWTADGERVGS